MPAPRPRPGRLVLLAGLGYFLLVTGVVVTRQQRAIHLTRERAVLEAQVEHVTAEVADLERRMGDAAGPGTLLPRVARRGLRRPVDTQFVVLRRPTTPP